MILAAFIKNYRMKCETVFRDKLCSCCYFCCYYLQTPKCFCEVRSFNINISTFLTFMIFFFYAGVMGNYLYFDLETGDQEISFDINVSMFTSVGVRGINLWRVGFFTSSSEDGSSPENYQSQILTDTQSSTELKLDNDLQLHNVKAQVSCQKSMKYVCLEFAKWTEAIPDFKFEVLGGGNSLIKCREPKCG